jgi:hypothetical protein
MREPAPGTIGSSREAMEAAMEAAAGGASADKQRTFACVECFRLRRKCEWQDEQCCKRCASNGLVCHARQTKYRRKVRDQELYRESGPRTDEVHHQRWHAHTQRWEPLPQANKQAQPQTQMQPQAQPQTQPQAQALLQLLLLDVLLLQHEQHQLNVAKHVQTMKQRHGQLEGAPHDDLLDEPQQHVQDRFCQPAPLDLSTMVTDRAPSRRGADKEGAPSLADGVDVGVANPGSIAVPDLDLDLDMDLDLELNLVPVQGRCKRPRAFTADLA